VPVAVNLSTMQFQTLASSQRSRRCCARKACRRLLELELTERMLMDDLAR
jgi:EAL domain-containing protein (putative c-di-GMP-specific phosphodiesterase class I)